MTATARAPQQKENAMNDADNRPAVVGQVEPSVRPACWAWRDDDGQTHLSGWNDVRPANGSVPLYDQAALDAAVAAERERCAQYCHDQRMALRAVLTDDDNGTWHDGVADGWGLAAVALRKGPNGSINRALPARSFDER